MNINSERNVIKQNLQINQNKPKQNILVPILDVVDDIALKASDVAGKCKDIYTNPNPFMTNLPSVAGGAAGAGLIAYGVKQIKEGDKISGVSSILAGTAVTGKTVANVIEATGIAGAIGPAVAEVFRASAGLLGVVHGGIEIVTGAKELFDGIKEKDNDKIVNGALQTALGGASLAAVTIGGIIPLTALLGIVVAKVIYNYRHNNTKIEG